MCVCVCVCVSVCAPYPPPTPTSADLRLTTGLWTDTMRTMASSVSLFLCSLLMSSAAGGSLTEQWPFEGDEYTAAVLNVTYLDAALSHYHSEASEIAKYGTGKIGSAAGQLVHVRHPNNSSHFGCQPQMDNEVPTDRPWIALVARGRCNFDDKVDAAYLNNASALIVYNNKDDGLQKMTLRTKNRKRAVFFFAIVVSFGWAEKKKRPSFAFRRAFHSDRHGTATDSANQVEIRDAKNRMDSIGCGSLVLD